MTHDDRNPFLNQAEEIEPLDEDDERILTALWGEHQEKHAIDQKQKKLNEVQKQLREAASTAKQAHESLDDVAKNHIKFEPLD
jgi:hypothetical protein